MGIRSVLATSFIIALSGLFGCTGALLTKEAEIHFNAAHNYDVQGDYESARKQYAQALMRANVAGADKATISMLTYNYGRTSGFTCHLQDAEKYLLEALDLERSVTGPESGISAMRHFELARFYYDQNNFTSSADHYGSGLNAVEKLEPEKSDPIAYAEALEEYADALRLLHRVDEAGALTAQASGVRARHPNAKSHVPPARYKCSKQ